jgi:uncharacterized UBP type Zn finger protein
MTHKASSPEYVLRAVVVHHGKYFNSGHYTTFCYKDSEKKDGKSSGWVQERFSIYFVFSILTPASKVTN